MIAGFRSPDSGEYMIYVGTDISKEKFDVCSMDSNGDLISTEECTNDSKGFEKFIEYVKTITELTNELFG